MRPSAVFRSIEEATQSIIRPRGVLNSTRIRWRVMGKETEAARRDSLGGSACLNAALALCFLVIRADVGGLFSALAACMCIFANGRGAMTAGGRLQRAGAMTRGLTSVT